MGTLPIGQNCGVAAFSRCPSRLCFPFSCGPNGSTDTICNVWPATFAVARCDILDRSTDLIGHFPSYPRDGIAYQWDIPNALSRPLHGHVIACKCPRYVNSFGSDFRNAAGCVNNLIGGRLSWDCPLDVWCWRFDGPRESDPGRCQLCRKFRVFTRDSGYVFDGLTDD